MSRDRGDEQAGQRDQQQVLRRGQVRREQAADPGAGQAAEAPRGVEPRHYRAAQRGHQVDRDTVHGHIEAAVGGPEHQQQEPQRDNRMGQRGEHQRHG